MPRSRNIKPSLFKNEVLGEADPLLTILFTGLWCLADREGRMEDRPKRIKAEIFPYRDIPDFNGYLTMLEQLGFITRYCVGGCAFIQVENFSKHQSPHKTERASEIPENPVNTAGYESTGKEPLDNGSVTVKESLIPDSGLPDSSNTDNTPLPPKGEAVPFQEIVNLYHEHLPMLPRVVNINDSRKRAMKARWSESVNIPSGEDVISMKCNSLDFWARYFRRASVQPFLTGDVTEWNADFDFLVKKNNFIKVIENKYAREK